MTNTKSSKVFFTVPFAVLILFAATCFAKSKQTLKSPESVLELDTYLLVSNVGPKLEPSKKDGDGFIAKVSKTGKILDSRFLPKSGDVLHAPKGMALAGGVLYVTDIDHLKGFDLKSKKKVFDLSFEKEKTTFLNDIAAADEKTLYVSATDLSKIYRVSLGGKPKYTALATDHEIAGANGLFFEKGILFGVGMGSGGKPNGRVFAVATDSGKVQYLGDESGLFDGLWVDGNKLYFSDWVSYEGTKGRMMVMELEDLSSLKVKSLQKWEGIPLVKGPADFYYNTKSKTLYLPRMMESRLSVFHLK